MSSSNQSSVKDPHLRVVTVQVPASGTQNIYLSRGSRLLAVKTERRGKKTYAMFWVDVSGEQPTDYPDTMPDGWDYRTEVGRARDAA